jgi:hypothetical protein
MNLGFRERELVRSERERDRKRYTGLVEAKHASIGFVPDFGQWYRILVPDADSAHGKGASSEKKNDDGSSSNHHLGSTTAVFILSFCSFDDGSSSFVFFQF